MVLFRSELPYPWCQMPLSGQPCHCSGCIWLQVTETPTPVDLIPETYCHTLQGSPCRMLPGVVDVQLGIILKDSGASQHP